MKVMKRKPSMILTAVTLSSVIVLMTVPAAAQMVTSARCGTKIVKVGDTKDQVLAKCGPPTHKSPGRRGGGAVWYYNAGSGKFTGIAKFTGPNLTSIELGDYGYSQPTPKKTEE
jgi:hypothetical protein